MPDSATCPTSIGCSASAMVTHHLTSARGAGAAIEGVASVRRLPAATGSVEPKSDCGDKPATCDCLGGRASFPRKETANDAQFNIEKRGSSLIILDIAMLES